MRFVRWSIFLGLIGAATGWYLSRPISVDAQIIEGMGGDPVAGELIYWAGGCASCHAADNATGDELLVLGGGQSLPSDFGSFIVPNISTDADAGIGGWSTYDLVNAMLAGVSPNRQHYYPSFPYTSFTKMTPQDVVDLKSFLDTLPASSQANPPHELGFPFNIRRGLGLWKQLYLIKAWVLPDPVTEEIARGRYLVEGAGHCAECHTPRSPIGGLERDQWMQGAPDPSGKGRVPAIAPDKLTWAASDIAYYLETGFTPDFDSAGGHMAKVIGNMARLPASDRAAIAAYLKAIP
ncbi:MAG: cytochrome c [Paracoccaceae bacterium]